MKILNKCLESHKEKHYRLKEPIEKLFEEEKPLMISFETGRYESRKVNKYGLIDFPYVLG